MTSPVSRPNLSRPAGGANRPAQRPSTTPGHVPTWHGGITRPTPLPGGGNRPGTGGGGIAGPAVGTDPVWAALVLVWVGIVPAWVTTVLVLAAIVLAWVGIVPVLAAVRSGDYRPWGISGGNRPGLGDYRPGVGGNRPGLGGNRPGLGDYRPGAGGNRPGLGGNRPGRPDFGDHLGIVNRPNPGNFPPRLRCREAAGSATTGTSTSTSTTAGVAVGGGSGRMGTSQLPLPRQLVSRELGEKPPRRLVRPGRPWIRPQKMAAPRFPHLAPSWSRRLGTRPVGPIAGSSRDSPTRISSLP